MRLHQGPMDAEITRLVVSGSIDYTQGSPSRRIYGIILAKCQHVDRYVARSLGGSRHVAVHIQIPRGKIENADYVSHHHTYRLLRQSRRRILQDTGKVCTVSNDANPDTSQRCPKRNMQSTAGDILG